MSTSMKVGAEADLDVPGDVVVAEIFGDDPLSERCLPSLAHARKTLLTPDAAIVPHSLFVTALLVSSPSLLRLRSAPPTQPSPSPDAPPAHRRLVWNLLGARRRSVRIGEMAHREMSERFRALDLSFNSGDIPLRGDNVVTLRPVADGHVDAVVFWYSLCLSPLDPSLIVDTSPESKVMRGRHWQQACYFPEGGWRVEQDAPLHIKVSYVVDRITFELVPEKV
eukprot:CAMPEP_0175978124 /NCGR_PEP_ID=MMETSP0108-20121206/45469_1 /TAXON_ID=195067 ORGANISM="Goniomonas pacifica, Strain CCMP1869" /NCGR_SAMPLE_ID=MMETSP0108 /ASSEMBLY_ACC=CAM_ASM_000204 /LENGTH=222 /DNA_ID=CAMNT_0017308235 /DNA_START=21 /DNA_END=690 /DNA_ORIENTATION=-